MAFSDTKNRLNTIIENNNNNSTFQHNIACKKAQVGRNFRYFSEHNIFKTKMNKATWVFTGWSNKLVTYLEKCQPSMMENFGKKSLTAKNLKYIIVAQSFWLLGKESYFQCLNRLRNYFVAKATVMISYLTL